MEELWDPRGHTSNLWAQKIVSLSTSVGHLRLCFSLEERGCKDKGKEQNCVCRETPENVAKRRDTGQLSALLGKMRSNPPQSLS